MYNHLLKSYKSGNPPNPNVMYKVSPAFTYSSSAKPIAVQSAAVVLEKMLMLLDGETLQ